MENKISVELVDWMGNDISVVNAARVSFDKMSEFRYSDDGFTQYLEDGDKKLIRYLALHNHWSPFAHTCLQFRVTAPIFVARQLVKHQIGLTWNEISRRYVSDEPSFYQPESWRGAPINKKQGSSEITITQLNSSPIFNDHDEDALSVNENVNHLTHEMSLLYEKMLEAGIAPEQARMVLPQSAMTSWIWTGSLYAFARIDSLRTKPDAQKETRDVAVHFGQKIKKIFPVSWHYLTNTAEINRLTIIKDFIKENNLNGFEHIDEQYNAVFDLP